MNNHNYLQITDISNHENVDIIEYPLELLPIEFEPVSMSMQSKKKSSSSRNRNNKSLLLNSHHLSPIINRKWKEVLSWATFHPDEVSNLRDNHNQTILHHACLFKAPYDIIEALLFAESTSGLLSSVANNDGEFAIHWAVRVSASAHVLKTLVNSNPKSGFMIDKHGDSAFSLIWERNTTAINSYVFDGLFTTCPYRTHVLHDTLLIRSRFEVLWNKNQFAVGTMMMLLYSYCFGNTGEACNKKLFLPLHAVAVAGPHVPFSFFTFIAKIYHDDIRKRDDMGRDPLALACSSADANIDIINFLLLLDPDSPSVQDYQGRYPLSIAVEAGLPWDMCIQSVFNAAPHVVSVRDVNTGLYPFMLASIEKNNFFNCDTTCTEYELNRLNTTFFLLLKDPECVRPLTYFR